ncbi:MAG: CDGSH iron-sulfur domain-containing protein [Actinobacteria bacterium]|nr:CDGSH iron-sulfur domain-containing protein [Actinomycetota bacterium]
MKKIKHSQKKVYKISVTKNGPYIVSGNLPMVKEIILSDNEGYSVEWGKESCYPIDEEYHLCRCGQSKNKPYCDETHAKIGFIGAETAKRTKYIKNAKRIPGPELVLTDDKELCAHARFCDRAKGIWQLTEDSDDNQSKEIATQEACNCPSGRLVIWDKKTGEPIEPELNPSISIVEDPEKKVSGPIWLKGGVPVKSSNGKQYEIRNRVTLCRCGQSKNKPFCDGSHISAGFTDSDESLKPTAKNIRKVN